MVSRVLLFLLILSSHLLFGQISVTSFGSVYSQNFDMLANSGTNIPWTNNTTIPGWYLFRQPAPGTALTTYNASDGSSTTGSMYSFGSVSSAERALGALGSGAAYWGNPAAGSVAGWIAVAFENNTGQTISQVSILYDGEQWRDANTMPQSLVLEYGIGSSFTTVGSWALAGSAFDFVSPSNTNAGAIDGNTTGKVANIGGAINLTWNNGEILWVRWRVLNAMGNDHGLGIDEFKFAIPEYSITTTGGIITITDLVGYGDILDVQEPFPSTIQFEAVGRTYSLNGGPALLFPVSLSLSSITDVVINAEGGNDNIQIQDFTLLPSLTVNGGEGDDLVEILGDITFDFGSFLDLDLTNDAPTPGIDDVLFHADADVTLTDANVSINVSRSVTFSPLSSIVAYGDFLNVSITANSVFPLTSGSFIGIYMYDGALIQTNGSNSSTYLNGRGGDGGGGQAGIWIVSSEVIADGFVNIQGIGGDGFGDFNSGVALSNNSTVSGKFVSMFGNGGGQPGTGTNWGTYISNSTVSGDFVSITGIGGSMGTNDQNHGVLITDNASISGLNNVYLYGSGGGANISAFNTGVFVESNAQVVSPYSVYIYGQGGTADGNANLGTYVRDNALVSANFISINGYGGGLGLSEFNTGVLVETNAQVNGFYVDFNGWGGFSNGNNNRGVLVRLNATVHALADFSGYGQGGSGSGQGNVGFNVGGGAVVSSDDVLYVYGYGGGGVATNQGVRVAFDGELSGNYVYVEGHGGSNFTGTEGYGVALLVDGSNISSSAGTQIYGYEGAGPDNYGIFLQDSTFITSTGGQVQMQANSMDLNAPASISAPISVNLTNLNFSVGIDIGSTTEVLGGPLSLSDAELDLVSTPLLVIGDTLITGDVVISAPITINNTDVEINAAGNILFSVTGGTFDVGTSNDLTLDPGFSPSGVYPDLDGVDARTAPSTFKIQPFDILYITVNGTTPGDGTGSTYTQLTVEGGLDITSVYLEVIGSYVPTGGEVFIVGVNDSTDAVVGTFLGLPEGGIISNILGSGLNGVVSYVGGTGNDITITVEGSCMPPSFTTCPINIVVPNAPGQCGTAVSYTATASGSPAPTLSYVFSGATTGSGSGTGSGAFFNVGTTNVTITATNACPPDATCTFQITVNDTQAPTITCPGTQILMLDASCQATLPAYSPAAVSDNCAASPAVTQTPAAGTTVSGTGPMTVTLTADDGSGNTASCTFTVNKVDNAPPSITCPSTQTLMLDASCQATLPAYSPAAVSDNCAASPAVTQTPAAGTTVSGTGPMTVTLTADDGSGNTASCTFTVNKVDDAPPSITCPGTQTLMLDASCQATLPAYSPASVSDNCTASPAVTQTPAAGTTVSGTGPMTVTLTADDGSGNTASCTFTVNKVDNTPPSITCPSEFTLYVDENCEVFLPNYTDLPTKSDNCSTSVTITQSPLSETLLSGVGTTVVTFTANDGNGNTASCTVNVVKRDTMPPTVGCPSIQTLALNASCQATLPAYSPAAFSDNCAASPTVTQTPAAGTTVSGTGPMTVTLTADDGNGNTASCTFTVNKVDNTPPSITCPSEFTLYVDENCEVFLPNYTDLPTKSDNCSTSVTITQSPLSETLLSGVGTTVVTFTANDGNGNTASCTVNVVKRDTMPPTVGCPSIQTLALNASCQATLPAYSPAAFSDNCAASPTVTQTPAAGTTVSGSGPMTVTLTVNDGSGNTASCSFVVLKTGPSSCGGGIDFDGDGYFSPEDCDDTNPSVYPGAPELCDGIDNNCNGLIDEGFPPLVITCPSSVPALTADARCRAAIPDYTSLAEVSGGCSAPFNPVVQMPAPGTIFNPGRVAVKLTASNTAGQTASCTFHVTILGGCH